MAEETKRPQLHIVRAPQRAGIKPDDFQDKGTQSSLFPDRRRGLLIFVYFADVTEHEFMQTLEYSEPSYVFEFRSAPRFDVGKLTRQLAFQAFSAHRSIYVDLTSSLMGKADSEALIGKLRHFLADARFSFDHPVMFLINKRELNEDFAARVLETVSSFNSASPEIYEVPHFEKGLSASPR
jgi:hypothetical protein